MYAGTRVAGHLEWPLALYYLNENLNSLTVLCEVLQYGVHELGLNLLHVYRQRFCNWHFGRIYVCLQCNIGQLGIICMLSL